MDKQNVVDDYAQQNISQSLKGVMLIYAAMWINLEDITPMASVWQRTANIVWFHFCELSSTGKFRERENIAERSAGANGGKSGELLFS